jgi:hypothetical protein
MDQPSTNSDEFYLDIIQKCNTASSAILQKAEEDKKQIEGNAYMKINDLQKELYIINFNEEECIIELEKWFHLVEQKCFQGGEGHRISWNFIPFQFAKNLKKLNPHFAYCAPHNWMCSILDYPILQLSPKLKAFTLLHGSKIIVDTKPTIATWN